METRQVSVTGNDTLILNGHNFTALADGDNSALTFPNETMTVKSGKNGNTVYAANRAGQQAELLLRLIRGSVDDRYLNGLQRAQDAAPEAFVLINGTFIKRSGNGLGFITNDSYLILGGVFFKKVEAKSNAEGDTDQAVAVYSLRFGSVERAIM